jgi:CxxC motif-containing protein
MFEIMAVLHACKVQAPIKRGDVIIENVCGTGANIIASRDM